jgi:hypothetical protein
MRRYDQPKWAMLISSAGRKRVDYKFQQRQPYGRKYGSIRLAKLLAKDPAMEPAQMAIAFNEKIGKAGMPTWREQLRSRRRRQKITS